ncbi:hypothetical protein FRC09_015016 [Ceratobasidium sp. 395]|nr:hypothetical protein FRC09_015016 [Ceratobasidium sp. 395]
MSSMQLTTALNHAIAFLLRPLIAAHVEHRIIDALHIRLMVHLAAHFQPTWDVLKPWKGSLSRVLFISARCPPRVLKAACEDVGLLWGCWGPALIRSYGELASNEEIELRVDPGKVEVSGPLGAKVIFEAVGAKSVDSMLSMTTGSTAPSTYSDDGTESDVDLEVVLRTLAIQDHDAALPSPALTVPPSPSDSDHGLDAFYIDTSRKEVTIYESGKVGVLGGAVMLGMPAGGFKPKARGGRRSRAARV